MPAGKPKPPKGQYHNLIPSDDPIEVAAMWTGPDGAPCDYNIGISCRDILALDVDNKGAKHGDGSLSLLAEEHGLDLNTVETRTPTGGRHLFYRLLDGASARNTVEKLAPGIDTRGQHGYVLAPGSVLPEGEYRWARSPDISKIAPAPDTILRLVADRKQGLKTEQRMAVEGLELDSQTAIERARLWLVNDAPEAWEGSGGNNQTYQVACTVGDFGIDEPMCLELLAEHWNENKAHPPWSAGELETLVANAYSFGKEPIGVNSAQAQFEAVELASGTPHSDRMSQAPKPTKLFWEGFNTSRHKMASDGTAWLVKRYLGRNEMSVLYGDSNTGKTFVALDLAYHIATGMAWNGHKVNGGLVVYVAAEAGPGIRARLEALQRRYKPGKEPPLVVVPCMVDLFNPLADLRPLLALLEEVSKAYGMPITMVVLDTLARVIGAGDENSAKDMGQLVRSMDRIRVDTEGAHAMVVHHSGKNAANGARGSSALRAATETELEIKDGRIIMRKQRNGEIIKPVTFKLASVELGKDVDGDSVTSCTVDIGASVIFEPQLTPEQQGWVDQLAAYEKLWQPAGGYHFTTKRLMAAWGLLVDADISQTSQSAAKRAAQRRCDVLCQTATLTRISVSAGKESVYVLRHGCDIGATFGDSCQLDTATSTCTTL